MLADRLQNHQKPQTSEKKVDPERIGWVGGEFFDSAAL